MADYISREAFKGKYLCCGYLPEMPEKEFDEFPAADVEPVVRCKDCKRWQRHSEVNRDYGGCRRYSSTMRYDDFCSRGERRTDNENR